MISICGFAGTRRKYCALLAETCKRLLLRRKLSRYYAYPASVRSKITRYLPLAFYEKKKKISRNGNARTISEKFCRLTIAAPRSAPINATIDIAGTPSARSSWRVQARELPSVWANRPRGPSAHVHTSTHTRIPATATRPRHVRWTNRCTRSIHVCAALPRIATLCRNTVSPAIASQTSRLVLDRHLPKTIPHCAKQRGSEPSAAVLPKLNKILLGYRNDLTESP